MLRAALVRLTVLGGAFAIAVIYLVALAAPGEATLAPVCTTGTVGSATSFSYTGGEQCYTVPAGVQTLHVVAFGAAGGGAEADDDNSLGAEVTADIAVPSGVSTLYVEVGGAGSSTTSSSGAAGGFNGGGAGNAGASDALGGDGGGGATDLQTCSITSQSCIYTGVPGTDPRLIVAGGAGGGVGNLDDASGGAAGYTGEDGYTLFSTATGGGGGTQTAAGTAGTSGGTGTATGPASAGVGGTGGDCTSCATGENSNRGGGGGGGWFGGGGGGAGPGQYNNPSYYDGGAPGGGGSSYATGNDATYDQPEPGQPASLTIVPYASSSTGATGATGATGSPGQKGSPGAKGATGPQGPQGASGKVILDVCTVTKKHGKTHTTCKSNKVSGIVTVTVKPSYAHATLTRDGRLYATGIDRRGRLTLTARRKVAAGRYTLTLRWRHHVLRRQIVLS